MIVCLCHRITDSQIVRHAKAGCGSFEELQDDLRVATSCGACRDCAVSTFESARGGCGGGSCACHGREEAALALAA